MLSCGARVHSQIYMAASSLTALRTSCSGNGTLGLRGTHGVLACCALACGKCGGEKCSDRPGGRSQCCALDVKRSDRVCDMHPPPCVPSLKSHMTVAQYVSSVDPGATAPQVVRNTPIYIEHIHKAGGTTVCKTLRISRGCRFNSWTNCKFAVSSEQSWLNATNGKGFRSANISRNQVDSGMAHTPGLCGVVANEPGYHLTWGHGKAWMPHRFDGGDHPFWRAYHTVLLVRDPWKRFVSHLLMAAKTRPRLLALMINSTSNTVKDSARTLTKVVYQLPGSWWHNFMTRHLVYNFRECGNASLQVALSSVDRFTTVLNFADFPLESACVATKALNASFVWNRTARANPTSATIGGAPTSETWRSAFIAANQCDYAVVERANRRLRSASKACRLQSEM